MHLCIFNPEHDLCLGNGRAHYMPPQSAVELGQKHAGIMSVLYPDATCFSVHDLSTEGRHPTAEPTLNAQLSTPNSIIPWGWNVVLRQQLLDAGVDIRLLPSPERLERLRQLQHRATLLPLQPDTHWAKGVDEVERLLNELPRAVLKAPWSGSGRGLRWVDSALTDLDKQWVQRMAKHQGGVIVEPWRDIELECALEYEVRPRGGKPTLLFRGLSLFESRHGVYRGNWLWDDDIIQRLIEARTNHFSKTRSAVERWLRRTIVPYYAGPIGIDLHVDSQGALYVGEMNLRHTMGMVAHALQQQHPSWEGTLVSPLAMHRVVLSLGSNMGNRALLLRRAIQSLSKRVGPVVSQSSVVETEPWGFDAHRNFLNQVAVVDTVMSAEEVLDELLDIEWQLGRRRDYDPMHPPKEHAYRSRPIDIDILFYDDVIVESERLQLPHPRMHLRRFVLEPLCELMPEFEHPTLHKTMKELLEGCVIV